MWILSCVVLCILLHENIVQFNQLYFKLDIEIQTLKAYSLFLKNIETDRETNEVKHRLSKQELIHDDLYTKTSMGMQ